MQPNIGTIDRLFRLTLGLALIGLALTDKIGAWGWIGLVPLATGVFQVCPAYLPFRLNTCLRPDASAER